jgi:hypothetical protein
MDMELYVSDGVCADIYTLYVAIDSAEKSLHFVDDTYIR